MRIKRLAAAFTLFMLLFLFQFMYLYGKSSVQKRDIVFYNDLLYKVQADMESGREISEIEEAYDCRVVIAKALDDPVLAELYAEEAFVLDLMIDGEYVGKVAWLDKQQRRDAFGQAVLKAALVLWGLTLLMGYGALLVIWLFYIRPVNDLKQFSEELARGNLDASLPIRRTNLFGGFSEAFDIMREELKASQERRMEAELARKELVASLSHDIKTPVAVIDATCEVLEVKWRRKQKSLVDAGGSVEADIREIDDSLDKVGIISSKTKTIQTLLAELLHTNLEGTEQARVNPAEEYATLIEDHFVSIRSYGGVVLENHIPKCLIYMDRKRMEQVIDNVVGNAVKYGGTEIRVSFDEVNDMMMADGATGSFIRIRVKDNGPGVSEDDLPLIAQKYYRGSNAADKSGYGMGLYLVRQYMQKQGGDVEYYNDHGFTVVLMLKKV